MNIQEMIDEFYYKHIKIETLINLQCTLVNTLYND